MSIEFMIGFFFNLIFRRPSLILMFMQWPWPFLNADFHDIFIPAESG